MAICTETLTFYTPYSDLNKMIGALKKVFHLEIKNLLHRNNLLEIYLMNNDRIEVTYSTKEHTKDLLAKDLDTLYDQVINTKVTPTTTQIKENLLTQIRLVNSVYKVEFEYDEELRNERIVSLMEVADNLTSLILWETGDISNSYGDIILSKLGESEIAIFNPIDESSLTIDRYHINDKQKHRLQRSTQILRYKGIYAPSDLCIPDEIAYYTYLDKVDISKKAVSCMILAIYAGLIGDMGWSSEKAYAYVEQMIEMYGAGGYFTPDEIDFLNEAHPSKELSDRFLMYYEYSNVLLWALGFFKELSFPDVSCNSSLIVQTIFNYSTIDELAKHARLQDHGDMLDALDLIQRYEWACHHAMKEHYSMPAKLNPVLVVYRHHALKWLISDREETWNKVNMKIEHMKRL